MAARNRFANNGRFQTEATREDVDLLWVTRAIIDDPSDHLPPPNDKDLAVNEEILDAEAWNLGTDHLWAYSDGSCTQELSREMKRASWGLIFYNLGKQKPSRVISGPSQLTCGRPARQASLQAWLWLWMWRRVTPVLWSIAKRWTMSGASRFRNNWQPARCTQGFLLSSYRDQNRPNVKQVKWVKSHRTLDQATSAEGKARDSEKR